MHAFHRLAASSPNETTTPQDCDPEDEFLICYQFCHAGEDLMTTYIPLSSGLSQEYVGFAFHSCISTTLDIPLCTVDRKAKFYQLIPL